MNKLVYNGSVATTFSSFHLALEPGDVFHVSDDALPHFIGRPDIEVAPDPIPEPDEPAPVKPTKKTAQ